MHQIIYLSSSREYLSPEQINELLSKSREKNLKNNITGVLLYFDRDFLQVLEGPKHAIQELFEVIKKDERHTGILTVFNKETTKKHFPEWNMGFASSNYEKLRTLIGFENFDQKQLYGITDKIALTLIDKFLDSYKSSFTFV